MDGFIAITWLHGIGAVDGEAPLEPEVTAALDAALHGA